MFRSLRLYLLIAIKYASRHRKKFLLGFLVLALVSLIAYKVEPNISSSTYLSEGLIGTYQANDLPEVLTQLISDPLVEMDQNGRPSPKLVSGWEVNNDATIFKFRLKDNLMWSDGSKVKSNDLPFNIPDVEVSYPDQKTIQFKLGDSFSPFPTLLTKPVLKNGMLIGTGPYRVIRIEKSRIFITKVSLEPISHDLPKLNVRFYPNEKTASVAFDIGEIQSFLGVTDTSSYTQNPLAKLKQKPTYSRIAAILYNTSDPLLSNRSFRQALSYSAPKIEGEEQAKTAIAPFSWAYYPKNINNYLSNTEQAKTSLGRAKASANSEILKKELVLTATPQFEQIGKQVVATWKALGVNSVLRVESGIPQNFQALLIAQSIPPDPDQYSLWHSTQTKTNLTKYSSARIDKDLEDGRKLLKEEDRRLKYIDFQEQLDEDAPATFLFFPKYNVVYLKKAEQNLDMVLPRQLPK